VIGVCNAADPADNEGLYAGIGSIHAELARKGLSEMIVSAGSIAPSPHDPPAMAQAMPAAGRRDTTPRVVPTSADDPHGAPAGQVVQGAVTPAERSLLEKLRASAGDAEVICIVRPLADPHAMSEIVVIDRASPDLVRQLSTEGRTQTTRRLTSLETKPAIPAPRSREDLVTSDSWQPNTGVRRFR
jgi:hypothetical protein